MSLPCAVVEARDEDEVLVIVPTVSVPMVACGAVSDEVAVSVPTVSVPMVAFPKVARLATSVAKRPFTASRRPEKYPVEAESPVRVVDVPALVTVREPVSVYPVVFVFAA